MKYKEFQSGLITVPENLIAASWDTGVGIERFEETCAEYNIVSLDVINRGTSGLMIRDFQGWDSLAQKLYSPIRTITAQKADFISSSGASAVNGNNLAIRLKRTENITSIVNTYGTNSFIAAGARGIVLASVADMQIMAMQFQRQVTPGDMEVMGIFKGALEGISNVFSVTTTAGTSDWVDCRAYGYAGFEVINNGGTALTSCSVDIRRHPLGINDLFSLNAAPFVEENPVRRIQRIRNNNPATITSGLTGRVDFDVTEAHSIRFVIAPTNAQVIVRGILKG